MNVFKLFLFGYVFCAYKCKLTVHFSGRFLMVEYTELMFSSILNSEL